MKTKQGLLEVANGNDLLDQRSIEMTYIKIKVILDRKFDVPITFMRRIHDDDICALVETLLRQYPNYFTVYKREIVNFIKNYLVWNSPSLAEVKNIIFNFIVYNRIHDLSDLVIPIYNSGYSHIILKTLRTHPDEISIEDIKKLIYGFARNEFIIPIPILDIYISRSLNKKIFFRRDGRVYDILTGLMDGITDIITGNHILESIFKYPTFIPKVVVGIYRSETHVFLEDCWEKGFTWVPDRDLFAVKCNDSARPVVAVPYIESYLNNEELHRNIPVCENVLYFLEYHTDAMFRSMLLNAIRVNPDNINVIYWELSESEKATIENIMDRQSNPKLPKDFSNFLEVMYWKELKGVTEYNPNTLSKAVNYTLRYIGQDDSDINVAFEFLTSIKWLSPGNVNALIANITDYNLTMLLAANPKISYLGDTTFIDLIMESVPRLPVYLVDKLRATIGYHCGDKAIVRKLYNSELSTLYGKYHSMAELVTKYPTLIELYKPKLTFKSVMDMYQISNQIISYVPAELISPKLLVSVIKSKGWIPLNGVPENYGFEDIIDAVTMIELLNSGHGFGYLADILHVEFSNLIIYNIKPLIGRI